MNVLFLMIQILILVVLLLNLYSIFNCGGGSTFKECWKRSNKLTLTITLLLLLIVILSLVQTFI